MWKLGDIQGHSGNPQTILYVPIEGCQDTGGHWGEHMGTLGDPRDMEGLPQANPCPHRGVPGHLGTLEDTGGHTWGHWGMLTDTLGIPRPLCVPIKGSWVHRGTQEGNTVRDHQATPAIHIEGSQEHMETLKSHGDTSGGNMGTLGNPQATPCPYRGIPGHWETWGGHWGAPRTLPSPIERSQDT